MLIRFLIPIVVTVAALLRLFASLQSPITLPAEPSNVVQVVDQSFDPTAVVVIRPGADHQPGRAGTDDNRNGIVDDRLELGATHSDDVCQVVSAETFQSIPADQVMLMQRGAFVTLPDDNPELAQRRIEFHQSQDHQVWSVLREQANHGSSSLSK